VRSLQQQCLALIALTPPQRRFLVLLEYEIPRESRRSDVLLIGDRVALVIEFKGYSTTKKAFADRVFAYARDLRSYHRDLEYTPLTPVLALSGVAVSRHFEDNVLITTSGDVGQIPIETFGLAAGPPFEIAYFLEAAAYRPLPTLVRAACEQFAHSPLPTIKRAGSRTVGGHQSSTTSLPLNPRPSSNPRVQ
jgi:hypothetical protein